MISLRKIQVRTKRGKVLIPSLSMEVQESKVIAVYGPNGSGKTSLLKTIAGIEDDRIITGESWVTGSAMLHGRVSPSKKVLNALYIGSDFHSPFQITVRELLEMSKSVNSQSKITIAEVSEAFELTSLLNRSFSEMSDGEKQRVMLARGVLQSPKWLILDETFSKIDLDRCCQLVTVMKEYSKKGMGIVVTSHDLNLLSEVADELWMMKEGQIILSGSSDELMTTENLQKLYPSRIIHVVRSPDSGKKKVIY